MTLYRLTADARRSAGALVLGVIAVAVYAAWNLASLLTGGVQGPEWVLGALMIALLIVSPAVAWTLLGEIQYTVATDATGLTVRLLGVHLHYDWAQVRAVSASTTSPTIRNKAQSAGPSAEPGTSPSGPALPTAIDGTDLSIEERPAGDPAPAVAQPDPIDGPLYLHVEPPAPDRIAQPLVRLLYRQAYGNTLPLPAGLTGRTDLLAEIAARQSLVSSV